MLRLEMTDEIEMSVFFSHPKLIKINLTCYLPSKVSYGNKTLMVAWTNWLVLLKLLRVNWKAAYSSKSATSELVTFPLIPVTHFLNIYDKILYNETRTLRFVSKGAKLLLSIGKERDSSRGAQSREASESSSSLRQKLKEMWPCCLQTSWLWCWSNLDLSVRCMLILEVFSVRVPFWAPGQYSNACGTQ